MDDRTPSEDERLRALGKTLEAKAPERSAEEAPNANGMAIGMKYASEFAGAIIVSTLVGYFIGNLAGAKTAGLLIGLFLGVAAGTYSMVRSARNGMNEAGDPPT